MIRARLLPKLFLALALTSAIGVGSTSFAAPKCKPNPNAICPFLYAPVICNNGQIYSNQCFANAACAQGCVPYNNTAS